MIESYELPLFPLHTVLFPGQALPLHIFEPRYRQMMADCLEAERTFGVVLIREGLEVGGLATPYEVGTTARIEDIERLADGRMNIVTIGQERFRLQGYDAESKPYLVGRVSPWPWRDGALIEIDEIENGRLLRQRLERYTQLLSQIGETEINLDAIPQRPARLAVLAAAMLQILPEEKQALLEIPSLGELVSRLNRLLYQESRVLQIMLDAGHLQNEMDGLFSQN